MKRRDFIALSGCAASCTLLSGTSYAQEEEQIELCTQLLVLDDSESSQAFELAIEENSNNLAASPLEQAALRRKVWNPRRRILNVDFLQEPNYIDKIISSAKLWEPHMGLSFRFGRGASDILVSFYQGGSWSHIGTDSQYMARRGQPSMNFGWFNASTTDEEFRRVVCHEFGHALGMIHEHNHPGGRIPWNYDAVYRHYNRLGWDEDKVSRNIFAVYDIAQLNSTAYDPQSIMHYAIDRRLLTDPSRAVKWNTSLSSGDKRFIASLYPKTDVLLR